MSDTISTQGKLDLSYKVRSYVDFFDSYFKSLVPWHDKDKYYAFLLRNYVANGPLRGAISRLSSLIARPLKVDSAATPVTKAFHTMLKDLHIEEISRQIIVGMFIYPRVACVYMPAEKVSCKCTKCEEINQLNSSYKGTFQLTEPKTRSLTADDKLSRSHKVRRAHVVPAQELHVKFTCGACGEQVTSPATRVQAKKIPGVLKVLEPAYTIVTTNDAGLDTVRFEPRSYTGAIATDTDMSYSDIEGVHWTFVVAYATRGDTAATIQRKNVAVFRYESIVGTKNKVDVPPIISLMDDLMTVSVLKRGNEAVASSKVDPLYIVSPVEQAPGHDQSRFDAVNENIYKDFILEQTRAHAEGDLGRVVYSPMPVRADSLYGDGRRFLTLNEVTAYTNNALGGLGVNPNILAGQSGIASDPLSLEVLTGIHSNFSQSFLPLVEEAVRSGDSALSAYISSDGGNIYVESIRSLPGSYNSQVYTQLAQGGMAPMDRMYKEAGYEGTYVDILKQVTEEHIIKREQDRVEQSAMTKADRSDQMAQQDLQAQYGQVDLTSASNEIEREANMIVQEQLPNMPDGERKSYFDQLSKQQYALYATITKLWEQYKKQMAAQEQQQQ